MKSDRLGAIASYTSIGVFLVVLVFLAACGGFSSSTPILPPFTGPNTALVSLTITDAPPTGVSVLSFEVLVTGAVLQPGNVQLVTTPAQIELKRLETGSAYVDTQTVPVGTYTSLAVSFSNPELTIRNDGNAAIGAFCAVGAICEFKPAVSGTSTYNGTPFPLTITAQDNRGLRVDVNLNNLITSTNTVDFNAPGALVAALLAPAQFGGLLEDLEGVKGRITGGLNVPNQFNFQIETGRHFGLVVDSAATYVDFNDPTGVNCAANNFTCLAVGQFVEVDLRLMAFGPLIARKIKAVDNDNQEELEGIVVETANLPASFDVVLTDDAQNAAGVEVGQRVRVNLPGAVRLRIDADGLPVNVADFDATSDLRRGQLVEVERQSSPTGHSPSV